MGTETTYEVIEQKGKLMLREEIAPPPQESLYSSSQLDLLRKHRSEYTEKLKKLPVYPISGFIAEKGTKGLREGKDFQFEKVDGFFKGNYMNKCVKCGEQYSYSDKLWFLCPTCSTYTAAKPISPTTENKYRTKEGDFLSVLQENYQAQISGFYNDDKTDEERRMRYAVIQEYEDLIAIYKTNQFKAVPPSEEEIEEEIEKLYPIDLNEHQMRINHQTDEFDVTQQMAANDATIARREGFKACARWMIEKQNVK